jgi:hypothetical protein
MLDEATKKAVADYVLDQHDSERLKLLVNMQDSWETIRLRVINEFANQFARTISDALPASDGWLVGAERLRTSPVEKYTALDVRRSTWDEGLYVGVEAETWGPSTWRVGVWGKQGYLHPRLPAVIIETWGQGRKSEKWLWYRYFSDSSEFGHWELGDWRTGASIIALRDGAAGDYGKRLCERIIEMGKTVDGVFST